MADTKFRIEYHPVMQQYRARLDPIWLKACNRLEIPLVRGGDAYVHYDGRVLRIASDAELDSDDTLAQLVLHELCHGLVQGPAARGLPDWGLDNMTDRDWTAEQACLRLQAHLLAPFGLRAWLYPTTTAGRSFFESLPEDPMTPAGCPDAALAKQAAVAAAEEPLASVLLQALSETAELLVGPRHRSGFPLLAQDHRSCGDCVWRSPGGFCRQTPRRLRVDATEAACARHRGVLDCAACGACCREAYHSVQIGSREQIRRRHPELVVDRGAYLELRRTGRRCAALAGSDGGPFSCRVYDDRPRSCREFEVAGRHCLEARRRVGLELPVARSRQGGKESVKIAL